MGAGAPIRKKCMFWAGGTLPRICRVGVGEAACPGMYFGSMEPLPDHAGESTLLSRSGGEKGLRGSGDRTLGVPLGGTRRVGGLLGPAPIRFSRSGPLFDVIVVSKSSLVLCDPMDCSPPGSSIHGIFQARVLEWPGSPEGNTEGPVTASSEPLLPS